MAEDKSLQGKVCIVTGATKGIGRGIAMQLGQHGAKVYITGRSAELLEDCKQEIKDRGGQVNTILRQIFTFSLIHGLF